MDANEMKVWLKLADAIEKLSNVIDHAKWCHKSPCQCGVGDADKAAREAVDAVDELALQAAGA
jgi:hypothetical protein